MEQVTRWEYYVETFNLTERWSSRRQAEEVQKFIARLNAIGAEGWELVTQAEITLKGGITGATKGELLPAFSSVPHDRQPHPTLTPGGCGKSRMR